METIADQEHASSPAVWRGRRSLEAQAHERRRALRGDPEVVRDPAVRDDVLRNLDRPRFDLRAGPHAHLPARSAAALSAVGLVLFVARPAPGPLAERAARSPLAILARVLAWRAWRARRSARRATGTIATTRGRICPGSIIPLRVDGFRAAVSRRAARAGPALARRLLRDPADAARADSALLVAGKRRGPRGDEPSHRRAAAGSSLAAARRVVRRRSRLSRRARLFGARRSRNRRRAQRRRDRRARTNRRDRYARLGTDACHALAVERHALGGVVARRRSRDRSHRREPSSSPTATSTEAARSRASRADGSVTRVATGATAEGLAIDERRQIVYVANANDGTVAAVDARSMRVLRRFPAVDAQSSRSRSRRTARGSTRSRIKAPARRSRAPGAAVAIALAAPPSRASSRAAAISTSRSAPRSIATTQTLFVTDEGARRSRRARRADAAPRSARRCARADAVEAVARSAEPAGSTFRARAPTRSTFRYAYAAPRRARAVCNGKLSARRRGMASDAEGCRLRRARHLLLGALCGRRAPTSCPSRIDPGAPFPRIVEQAPTIESVAPGVDYGEYQLLTAAGPLADPRRRRRASSQRRADRRTSSPTIRSNRAAKRSARWRSEPRAVAGINGDYFDIGNTNRPKNIVVRDGALLQLPVQALRARDHARRTAAHRRVHVLGRAGDRRSHDAARRDRRAAAARRRPLARDAGVRPRAPRKKT